eukprot:CAMPEP_0119514090 /NCGR_PEP_ID=MMETSP1344-20130328/32005_1 /TAXON_ID=236787 /ORGANISM="Florenciella parvula, Strain CCMP2471" /LENGTH=108 /DNA_ID=CAMNT_0007551369 /DNA_START=49 /DNA_END=371 /DNA_ORIENTATION=+
MPEGLEVITIHQQYAAECLLKLDHRRHRSPCGCALARSSESFTVLPLPRPEDMDFLIFAACRWMAPVTWRCSAPSLSLGPPPWPPSAAPVASSAPSTGCCDDAPLISA